jgi:hypothetical protein
LRLRARSLRTLTYTTSPPGPQSTVWAMRRMGDIGTTATHLVI